MHKLCFLWVKLAVSMYLFYFVWLCPQKVILYRYKGQWRSSSDTRALVWHKLCGTLSVVRPLHKHLTPLQWCCTVAGCGSLSSCDVFTCLDISNWCLHNIKGLTKMWMSNLTSAPTSIPMLGNWIPIGSLLLGNFLEGCILLLILCISF